MPPVGGFATNSEAGLIIDLGIWDRQTNISYPFSSSNIFKLPNGTDRSPDADWICRERYSALTPEQRREFLLITLD